MNLFPKIAAALCLSLASAAAQASALDDLQNDGLYTWRVAATDDAPAWCCFRWENNSPVTGSCNLDGPTYNFGNLDNTSIADGEVQVYARIDGGKTSSIRTLSLQCPVTTRQEIVNLGTVGEADSLDWLKQQVRANGEVTKDAIASIAVHRGDGATRYLEDLAAPGNAASLREDAIFWMGQARIKYSADALERLMFEDRSADIREHAGFSYAQSSADNSAALLTRQGRSDKNPEVRSQAWFWLAQSGSPAAEAAIRRALAEERDYGVREQAVFALSQLPGDRGVDALIDLLVDRSLSKAVRKQALFWLAQSDSDRAHEYLGELLASGD